MIKCNHGEMKIKGNRSTNMAEFMCIVNALRHEKGIPEEMLRDRFEKALLSMEDFVPVICKEIMQLIAETKEEDDGK